MDRSLKKEALRYAKYFSALLDLPCSVVDLIREEFETDRGEKVLDVCELCPHKECRGFQQFAYGCREAYRWDGLYTFHCYQELIVICASIASEKGDLTGGLVIGPVCLDNKDELIAGADSEKYIQALMRVPEFSPYKIQAMSELLAGISGNLSDLSTEKQDVILQTGQSFKCPLCRKDESQRNDRLLHVSDCHGKETSNSGPQQG